MKAPMSPEQYLERIKPLRNPEEIEAICSQLTEALFNETDKSKTRVNKLSPYNKLVNTIPNEELIEGENAYIQTKQDGSLWKRHLHFKFTGLADTKWHGEGGINSKTVVLDRLENRREVNVAKYLEVTIKLLQSDDPHELAVGLIAASGRRPIEILARGNFSLAITLPSYLKPGYFVNFKGQAKKRDYDLPEDERSEYCIGVLVPADFFLQSFKRFRGMPEAKELQDLVKTEAKKGTDPEVINDMIDSRRGNSLRRVVSAEFSGFLPARFGETEINNKSLRAVYVRLITDRDCPKNIDGLLWASRAVGHFVDEKKPDDSQLKHLTTTLGYSDYYADRDVPFVEAPQKEPREKTVQIRATIEDGEAIKFLQDKLDLPNQQAVIHFILGKFGQLEKVERQLLEAQSYIAELEKRLRERKSMDELQPEAQVEASVEVPTETENDRENELEKLFMRLAEKLLVKAQPVQEPTQVVPQTATPQIEMPQMEASQAIQPIQPKPVTVPKVRQVEKDWSSVSSDELRASKVRGASDERIYRAFKAACDYNDAQPSNDQRWFIGNVTLRALSGCNGLLVKDWIERHQISVDDHNNKYGLGQYHNKRHKGVEVEDVIKW